MRLRKPTTPLHYGLKDAVRGFRRQERFLEWKEARLVGDLRTEGYQPSFVTSHDYYQTFATAQKATSREFVGGPHRVWRDENGKLQRTQDQRSVEVMRTKDRKVVVVEWMNREGLQTFCRVLYSGNDVAAAVERANASLDDFKAAGFKADRKEKLSWNAGYTLYPMDRFTMEYVVPRL